MLFILLLLILGIIIFTLIYRVRKSGDYLYNNCWLIDILGPVLGFGGVIIGFTIFILCMNNFKENRRIDYSAPIYSLRSGENISGSFFLGSGGIGSEEKYYFFVKDERGAFNRENKYAYNCSIFENDSIPPQMRWQKVIYKVPKWIIPWTQETEQYTRYDLYVPTGTIIQKFELK